MFSINETKLHHPSWSFVNWEEFLNILEFPYFHVFPYFHFHVGFHTTGASLVAQSIKNSPALQETWVQSLGQEDLLEKRMATYSSILAWKTSMDRGAWRATVHGITKSRTRLKNFIFTYRCIVNVWLVKKKKQSLYRQAPTFLSTKWNIKFKFHIDEGKLV